MDNCLFCKIIKGEIPSYKVYEDEYTYAFMDIAKDIDGHIVVVPKNHSKNILDVDNETLHHLMDSVKLISNHLINDCGYDGVNIVNNNNECAGQSVFHLHIHLLPRKKSDNYPSFFNLPGSKEDLETVFNRIKIVKK